LPCLSSSLPFSPLRPRLCGDGGEWLGDVLEGFAFGVDPENDLDHPAEDHDPGTDEITDEESRPVRAVSDQPSIEQRAERSGDLGDGEEHCDRLGADLDRPGLADREVGSARPGRREEEDDDPHECLRVRGEVVVVEEPTADGQQKA
jgi:hypothetical protein